MPTPDGREWHSSARIAEILLDRIADDVPFERRDALKVLLAEGFAGMYGIEFKILRLTEKLKDSIEAGQFGPLFVGNDPDQPTQAGAIWRAFRDIYTTKVLDKFDEEGNLKNGKA